MTQDIAEKINTSGLGSLPFLRNLVVVLLSCTVILRVYLIVSNSAHNNRITQLDYYIYILYTIYILTNKAQVVIRVEWTPNSSKFITLQWQRINRLFSDTSWGIALLVSKPSLPRNTDSWEVIRQLMSNENGGFGMHLFNVKLP